jgi:flagellar motor protein MotB
MVVRSVTLDGVRLVIDVDTDGVMRVGGITLPAADPETAGEEGTPWGFALDSLSINDTSITYRTPQLQLETHLDEFSLSDLSSWATEPAPLTLQGAVNGAALQLDGQLPPLSQGNGYAGHVSLAGLPLDTFAALAGEAVSGLGGSLVIDTDLEVLQSAGKPLAISQSGRIQTDGLALQHANTQLGSQQLQWNGTTSVSVPAGEGDLQVELRGGLTGNGLAYAQAGNKLDYELLQWDGAASVAVPGGAGDVRVDVSGEVNGNNLALRIPGQDLDFQHGKFLWDGTVNVLSGAATAVTANGHLNVGSLVADVADHKIELARIEEIDIGSVSLQDTGDIGLENLVVTNAVFAREAAETAGELAGSSGSVLVAGAITTDSIQITDGNQVSIGTLEWRDVTQVARREPGGQWRVTRIINTLPFVNQEKDVSATTVVEPGPEPAAGKPAGRVRVGELRVTGNSAVLLNDLTVQPPVSMRLAVNQAVLKNIDNGAPGQPIVLQGSIDKHSRIDIQGTMQPFADRPTLDLKNRLEGIPLTLLSPYTASAMGYELRSGHLDADATLKINKGQMDGQNKLVIRALEIKPARNKSQEEFDSKLSLPLDTALGMLRDKNNTITLDLPVSGDIDKPDFDISDVINTALGKALKTGSMTYLKLALQPYGALITVAQLAGEAATKVRLQPVMFAAGSDETPGESSDYLEKVAGILKSRPEVNIKVCGLAVEEDRVALAGPVAAPAPETGSDKQAKPAAAERPVSEEQLLELASQRAVAVKDFLVTGHGVTASRLVACQPQVESADEDNAPRVELLI